MRAKHLLLFVPAALVVFGLLYVAGGLRLGYKRTHVPRKRVSALDRSRAQRAFPRLEELTFKGMGDVTLRGWYVPPENGVVIIYVPGLTDNRTALLPEAELFAKRGYGALLFDPRAHGESDGDVSTWGALESEDTKRAVSLVRKFPGVRKVALLGFSVGASTVVLAGADNPDVDAVISYACWTSLAEELRDKTRRYGPPAALFAAWVFKLSGADVGSVDPEQRVARIAPRPLYMVAGAVDTDTPLPIMERMFAAAREPKELWVVPDVGHGGYFAKDPAQYDRHVGQFLRKVFGH